MCRCICRNKEVAGCSNNRTNRIVKLIYVFTAGSKATEFCHSDKLHLIIATSAFGLGVNCADIARIIHWESPNTLEELKSSSELSFLSRY